MHRKWWIISAAVAAALLTYLILGIERGSAPTFALFIGRFHPTVVHFPIAFLLLGVVAGLLSSRFSALAPMRPAVPLILLIGAISALLSVVLGYLLSLGGGYDESLLSIHMWLGLGVMVLAFLLAYVSWRRPGSRNHLFGSSMAALGIMVIVAGHLGGSLARGSGYLTLYLPTPVKGLIGVNVKSTDGLIVNVDSARVFADLVQPVLDRRCVKCHGPSKSKGDLRLDSREGLEKGGRDGAVLVPGNPAQSEIIRRITLPPFDEDAMPTDGETPLDVGETELIRWWIDGGASFDVRVADLPEMPTSVETYLRRVSAPRLPTRSGIFALDIPEADTTVIAGLQAAGLNVARIDPQAPFLSVSASSLRERFTDANLAQLRPIGPQIAELDLGHTAVTSAGAAIVAEMPHLTHLHLENTSVDDAALQHVADLAYLEYLNLYGTGITDQGLSHLHGLQTLRSAYLWQTGVTDDGAASLRRALPSATINTGAAELAASDSLLAL